ncbi:MAG: sensor histidine kinase [bacterium]
MILKLRKKLVIAAMLAFSLVLTVIIAGINIWSWRDLLTTAEETLTILAENQGSFPMRPFFAGGEGETPPEKPEQNADYRWRRGSAVTESPELRFESRYWSVEFDGEGTVSAVNVENIAAIDSETAVEYAEKVLSSGRTAGFTGFYRYRVAAEETGTRVIFLDCTRSLSSFRTFLVASVVLSLGALLVVLLLLILFSGRVVKPVAESYEKQKEFITNAGHEIKTPIAIINADAEVLELEAGENEFIDDIRRQTKRLAGLTADLIFLSKMEEAQEVPMVVFPFSDLVEEAAESFRTLAATQEKRFTASVEPLLEVRGDEEKLRQLVNILLDNAIKYCPAGGTISVRAEKHRGGVVFTVENTAENVTEEQLEHMFDRFYRGDKSRSTPGHGLGLSIARAVTDLHRGKITAQSPDGKRVKMTVILP